MLKWEKEYNVFGRVSAYRVKLGKTTLALVRPIIETREFSVHALGEDFGYRNNLKTAKRVAEDRISNMLFEGLLGAGIKPCNGVNPAHICNDPLYSPIMLECFQTRLFGGPC